MRRARFLATPNPDPKPRCDITDCTHQGFYHVPGHPDDVDLCTEHVNLACDCGDDFGLPCRLHGAAY